MSRLLIIACSGPKREGEHRAVDLYRGVMFNVLRKWLPREGAPDIYILSAKFGLVPADAIIPAYEQRMTKDRMLALASAGVHLPDFEGKRFNDVFIAGGALYRLLATTHIDQLRRAGIVMPGAAVCSTIGGIGQQRGQLGAYLRGLGGAA